MSIPFIICNELREIDNSCIFILKNLLQNEEMKFINKVIDEDTPGVEDYSTTCNVKSKYTTFNLISQKNPKIGKIVERVFKKIQSEIFNEITTDPIHVDYEYMQFRKIYGATRRHVDGISDVSTQGRAFSVIIALNDDYEGGEFEFPHQNVKVKLKAGEAIIFPPYWTHPHSTNDLIDGTSRYTINMWMCYKY